MGNCCSGSKSEPRLEAPGERERTKSSNRNSALTLYDSGGSNPFVGFEISIWSNISSYLKCDEVADLRLASLGIARAVTLHPQVTSHLRLNLDNCPWHDWVYKKRVDNEHLCKMWCNRQGEILFPRDMTDNELDIFISKGYLSRSDKVSFARCQKLTVSYLELLEDIADLHSIEVSLPNSITDSEMEHAILYLQLVTRLNCVGCSYLTDKGFKLIGRLRELQELYFLHNKQLTSLTFLGNLDRLKKLSVDGMLNSRGKSTPQVTDETLGIIAGEMHSLRELIIGVDMEVSGIGLVHLAEMGRLESLSLERGAGEGITDNGLKVLCSLGRLRSLRITHCAYLSDRSLNYLQHLHRIEKLELSCVDDSSFTDEGARQLSKLKNLKELSLVGWERLTDRGVYYLSKISTLECLNLRYCPSITDESLEHLRYLKGLRKLELSDCDVSSKARSRFRRSTRATLSVE
mmetsp:Transcript_28710/g.65343  ORF Transcript_28710/g.65343 Transcript_28710/m.65343 type:complete len:461 (+) Transcript_28710:300-1682(+)